MTDADAGAADMPEATPHAHWAAIDELFHQLLVLPEAERRVLLAACADAELRHEVEAMLAAHDTHGPVDRLVDQVMSPLLARPEPPADPAVAMSAHERYRVVERLGGGGMGVVYRARDERLERDVALKFLPPHLSADQGAKTRFLVEARAAAALEHPNICTVHEIGDTADGQLYIVMACYDGETLDRRIARAPLPVVEALRIAIEVARGLAKAHERGIVHRDIKPANVMITSDGLVKILDFGIAKLAGVNVTQTVGAIGTLAYMSPEQAFGETVDHRADIWSLGVVLYEMLTGTRPFSGPGEQALLVAALTADPDPISQHRDDVPQDVDDLIRKALAKQPAGRHTSASALLDALESCAKSARDGSGASDTGRSGNVSGSGAVAARTIEHDTTLARGGERRPVTLVACAIAGHEALVERLSPEKSDQVLATLRDAAHEIATRFGGIVNHFAPDGFVLLFGVPTAHEDDAVRGVRATLALHARVTELAAGLGPRLATALRLRSGIHIGLVVAQRLREGDRRFRITGSPADVAARLSSIAEADDVLISPETRRLVAPFVRTVAGPSLQLSSSAAPVVPHRVLGESDARSRLDGVAVGRLTPFVGRERERALLAEHLASACAGDGRFTVLIGEAGAGKSRLLLELRDAALRQGTRLLVGRCDAYGGSTPFLPFVDAAQDALGLSRGSTAAERHDAAVRGAIDIDPSLEQYLPLYLALLAIPSETYPVPDHLRGELFQTAMLEAIAVLFTLGARTAPTILVLEDWHWADEGSRIALRQLAEIVPTSALLLVVTSRPDRAMDWGSAEHLTLLHLAPLDGLATEAIARAVLGAESVDPLLLAQLHERTSGNPFFLEEVCEALREEGAVALRSGQATVADDTAPLHVPDTVQGVLRTRIDRLDPEARDVLRVASVIGRDFTRGVLGEVVEATIELVRALERLKASGLVQQTAVVPEPAYRFKHALMEEVAYESLLEHQRTTLHEAVGRAIERRHAAQLDEHVERLAHHYSRAESWSDAVRFGLRSAERTSGLGQYADALAILDRVEEWVLHLHDQAERRDLLADTLLRKERLCEWLGLRPRQLALTEAVVDLLAPHGPSERLEQAYLRQGEVLALRASYAEADVALAKARDLARARGDSTGERQVLRSIAFLRSFEARHEEALALIERVLTLGREAGDLRAEAGDLATMSNILRAMGQSRRAVEVLEGALERVAANAGSLSHAALLHVVGVIHRDLGDLDKALYYFERSIEAAPDPRHPVLLVTLPNIAAVQLQQGHVELALATYQLAVERNKKARFADGTAHACRTYGEALVGLERLAEAVPYLHEAAAIFAQLEDRDNEALMRRRLAVAHDQLGQPQDAHGAWARLRELVRNGDPSAEAEALEGMARAERRLPVESTRALAHYEDALALAMRGADGERELAVRNALGIMYWERQEFESAVSHFEAGLRLCRERGDRVHEGLMLNSLGASLLKLQRFEEAERVLEDSVQLTAPMRGTPLPVHALLTLARVKVAQGLPDAAHASALRALGAARTLGDPALQAVAEQLAGSVAPVAGAATTNLSDVHEP